jgi:hypothetical protein
LPGGGNKKGAAAAAPSFVSGDPGSAVHCFALHRIRDDALRQKSIPPLKPGKPGLSPIDVWANGFP